MKDIDLQIIEDGKTARLTITERSSPHASASIASELASIEMSAEQLSHLLLNLGHQRANMAEKIQVDLRATKTVAWRDVTRGPLCVTGLAPMKSPTGQQPFLALRHAGFGWLCFIMDHQGAASLGELLIQVARQAKATATIVMPGARLQ